jgi:short-subunit dehydrogenase
MVAKTMSFHHHPISNQVVVLVTGSSSGIGQSAVEEFAKHPQYKVWATMRNIEKSPFSNIPNVAVTSLDVTSDESVNFAVNEIIAEDGKIDVLINNAGFGLAGCLETVHIEEAKELFEVNLWGVMRVTQKVLPFMRNRRMGQIINLSSTSGLRGIPCFEIYTSSKFALEGMMDSLRYTLAPFNISVTNVNAGPVRTGFTDRFGKAEVGGKGTRLLDDETGDYLHVFTDRIIAGLNYRMQSAEGQSSAELGQLLVNLVHLKENARRITDIPFNIGSNRDSQKMLEELRKYPTGWGGLYNEILKNIPPVPEKSDTPPNDEL